MTDAKENASEAFLSEYWGMFIEGIIGGILTLYLISLGGFALLCGVIILIGEIVSVIYSVRQGEFKFLIVFLLTNFTNAPSGK